MSFIKNYREDTNLKNRITLMSNIDSICIYEKQYVGKKYSPFYLLQGMNVDGNPNCELDAGTSSDEIILRSFYETVSKDNSSIRNAPRIIELMITRCNSTDVFKPNVIAYQNIERKQTYRGRELIFLTVLELYEQYVNDKEAFQEAMSRKEILMGRFNAVMASENYEALKTFCNELSILPASAIRNHNRLLKDFLSQV